EVRKEHRLQHVPVPWMGTDALLEAYRHGLCEGMSRFDEVIVEAIRPRPVASGTLDRREDMDMSTGAVVVEGTGQQRCTCQQRDRRRTDGHFGGLSEELDLHTVPTQITVGKQRKQSVATHELD